MTIESSLRELNNAVLDLQSSDYNTYDRFLKRIATVLASDDLKLTTDSLKAGVNFEEFIAAADTGGSFVGSSKLNWPIIQNEVLGLSIVLIERGAENSRWFENFAFTFYYSGSNLFESIRKMVNSVVIPFSRDFATHVRENLLNTNQEQLEPTDFQRVFIVHGHETAPREMVARFVSKLGLIPIILHEQADQGKTIIEKLEANSNVGYAIIILTPDDFGRSKSEKEERNRARQNVILELGYFLGRLGRERVIALLKGDVEIPSDYTGVIHTPFDDGGGWRQKLAGEMKSAGFQIDWNDVMR